MKALIALLLLSIPASAGSWKLSIAVLAASHAADIHSSLGKIEANPLLRGPDGRFRAGRGIVLKSAFVVGMASVQWLFQRKRRKLRKPFAAINYFSTVAVGAVAIHNYKIRK